MMQQYRERDAAIAAAAAAGQYTPYSRQVPVTPPPAAMLAPLAGGAAMGAGAATRSTTTPSDQYTTPEMEGSASSAQMLHSRNPSDETGLYSEHPYVYGGTAGGSPEFDPYKGYRSGSSEEHSNYLSSAEVGQVPYHDEEPYHDVPEDDPEFWNRTAAWEAKLPQVDAEAAPELPGRALRVSLDISATEMPR
ncbi:hypothetical protein CALCODRAFT_293416 [Calocera cornea HHB12733]|uniref:Uncharacterized protein n=1 Tax=Calocera cornea HHB12733 TaxID=1353952 RepID=A0A165FR77_9BASI|nr:hypothetical protein CALCODRAFT_293416 [Calocera cornea HHB12733]